MVINHFTSAVPVLATSDVAGTVRYFEQTLGFKQQWTWGDPPVYAGVRAGEPVKPLRLFLQSNNYLAVVFCALAVDSVISLPTLL